MKLRKTRRFLSANRTSDPVRLAIAHPCRGASPWARGRKTANLIFRKETGDYAVALNIGIKQGITIAEGQVKRVSPGQFNTILEKISGSGNVDVSRARLQRAIIVSTPLADGTESHALIVSSDAYIREKGWRHGSLSILKRQGGGFSFQDASSRYLRAEEKNCCW